MGGSPENGLVGSEREREIQRTSESKRERDQLNWLLNVGDPMWGRFRRHQQENGKESS